jgi:hypothetical protein
MSKVKKATKGAGLRARAAIDDVLESRNASGRESLVAHARVLDAIDPERVQTAIEQIEAMRVAYENACAKLNPKSEMPQRIIATAHLAEAARETLAAIDKTFKATALKLRAKGKFESGPCVVSFDTQSGRRTPAWKEIAIEKARTLAQLKGKKFNEKTFVARIVDATEPTPDTYKVFVEVRE